MVFHIRDLIFYSPLTAKFLCWNIYDPFHLNNKTGIPWQRPRLLWGFKLTVIDFPRSIFRFSDNSSYLFNISLVNIPAIYNHYLHT